MSRPWGTIKSRLSEPPLPLKAHALAMLALPFVVAGSDSGMRWLGLALVALVLWPILHGSLDAWWIQAACIAITAMGLVGTWRYVSGESPGLSVFVSPGTFVSALVVLAIAGATLLAPATRVYCGERGAPVRKKLGFALVGLFIGYFPASALSFERRLPTRGNFERTPNLVFVGSDSTAPSALFVGGGRDVCVVILEPRSSSRSCRGGGFDPDHPHSVRTEHVQAWVLPLRVVRAKALYEKGPPGDAELLSAPTARANVFIVNEALDDIVGIRAYDANGRMIVDCPLC